MHKKARTSPQGKTQGIQKCKGWRGRDDSVLSFFSFMFWKKKQRKSSKTSRISHLANLKIPGKQAENTAKDQGNSQQENTKQTKSTKEKKGRAPLNSRSYKRWAKTRVLKTDTHVDSFYLRICPSTVSRTVPSGESPKFDGFPVENPTKKATASKLF